MEKRALSEWVWLGSSLRYLTDVRQDWNVSDDGGVLTNLRRFPESLDRLGLKVSLVQFERWTNLKPLTQELTEAVEAQRASSDDQGTPTDDQQRTPTRLTADQARRLKTEMQKMWSTVMAEATGLYAFETTPKRMNVETLLDTPADVFGPGVFDALPETARVDFAQAMRCIAFELPTAAAFHLMRGIEDVLRTYYRAVVKRNRVDPLLWGPMTQQLRARTRNPPPKALLDQLDIVRVNFRNPTQHPDATYDIHEAQDLLALAVDVVNRAHRASASAG